jgi:integrase
MSGSVYPYCSCKDPATGKRYPAGKDQAGRFWSDCPNWDKRGHRRWGFAVDLGRVWDEGKQRHVRQQLRRTGYATRADAEAALSDELPAIRIGTAPSLADRQLTTGQWAERWLDSKASLRASSRANYQQLISNYIHPGIGHIPLVQLRADHIDQLLAAIRSGKLRPATNRRGPDGTVSARTVSHVHACLRAILNAAVKRRLIPYSPHLGVEIETPEDHEADVWGPEEVEAFLAYAEENEPRMAIGFRLALRFGMRRGEIIALRLADVGDSIEVRRNAVVVGAQVVVGKPKSRAGERTIPLDADPDMTAALRRHRKRQAADRLAAGAEWEETGLLVTDEHGRMLAPWRLTGRFRELITEAGLPSIVLHEGRHTANSLWREAGVDARVRQAWMGHSTLDLTERIYSHVRPAAHQAAAELAAAYWRTNSRSGTR